MLYLAIFERLKMTTETQQKAPRKGRKIDKRETSTSTNGHFIDKKEMLEELKKSKAEGRMTERFATLLLLLARNYTRHPWFCRYPQSVKDDMVSVAVTNLCTKWVKFDETRPDANPFAYYTQACYRSFSSVAKSVKVEQMGRDKLLVMHEMTPSWAEESGEWGDQCDF